MRSPSLSLIPLVLSPEVRQASLQSLLRGHKVSPLLVWEDLVWGDEAVERVVFLADEAEARAEQERREAVRVRSEQPHRFMPEVLNGRICWLCQRGQRAAIHSARI